MIRGKPTFLTSGEMHYPRIPRELWKDRIWRSKMMGLNCMQTYVFWNATEGKEGHCDFSDNLDLDAWLSEVQAAGMLAIVRVGPYCCAEWEHGGFPAWLTAKPGMTVRDGGPLFLKYADDYLAKVEGIVAKHQIHNGGSVIMVQLENEHTQGWGTDHNDYLLHLYEQARANGLAVPLFFSGLHHGGDPSGQTPFQVGTSPWFSTEFWSGWIGKYGDMNKMMLGEKVAGTWKIIAFGGAGYDYYMVHGGTNFGYSGDSLMTSYDYAAPVGETGKFNNFYPYAKRAALFAQSFSDLLTGSRDDSGRAKADLESLRVSIRTNPIEGSFVLVDNFQRKVDTSKLPEIAPDAGAYHAPSVGSNGSVTARVKVDGVTLPHKGFLKVSATDPRMLLLNIPAGKGAKFTSICSNVMLRSRAKDKDVWVCYGEPGDFGEINYADGSGEKNIPFTYPKGDSIQEIPVALGGRSFLFLVVNTEMTQKVWLANNTVYIGPSFVNPNGSLEFPPEGGKAVIYSDKGRTETASTPVALSPLPALTNWTWRDAAPERKQDFDCSSWPKSEGLVPMARLDGYANRYGWYRASFDLSQDQEMNLHFTQKANNLEAWLNGEPADLRRLKAKAGRNTLSIFVKVPPRPKWFGVSGPVSTGGYAGLWGGIGEEKDRRAIAPEWTIYASKEDIGDLPALSMPDAKLNATNWKPTPELKGPGRENYFRGTFSLKADEIDSFLDIQPRDIVIYLNGRPYDPSDPNCKLREGTNCLLISWKPRRQPAKCPISIALYPNSPLSRLSWRMHGGLDGLDETAIVGRVTNWREFLSKGAWQSGTPSAPKSPTFYRTTFSYRTQTGVKETVGLVKTKDHLSAGHVWLNGHNLGECPQKEPLYMPEPWLKEGENDLVVFDFNGASPQGVELQRYEGAVVKP
ncbi:MAG: beta-galactosidase [Verrucomicrobia bacterium]|nr:beta-galactosidase [Verrucomicrobiota bacterium]